MNFIPTLVTSLTLLTYLHAQNFIQTTDLTGKETDKELIKKAARVLPHPRQLAYHQEEYIAFIHFGPNTFTGKEWGNGKEDPAIFNPSKVDTDQWVSVMKQAGMKKIIITVKHHDGYNTYQSRYNDTFSVRQSPWNDGKGDVLKLLSTSCKKYGLKLGVYLSPADLFQMESKDGLYGNQSKYQLSTIPTDPASFKSNPTKARKTDPSLPTFKLEVDDYNRYFMNQLYELLTEYGEIHEVWFDGAHPKQKGNQQYVKTEWFNLIRKLAPEAVIFGGPDVRWCGNEAGRTRQDEWNILPIVSEELSGIDRPKQDLGNDADLLNREYEVYGKKYPAKQLNYMISEIDTSIRHGWFYRDDDKQSVRSADDVFDIYERSVGTNGVLLLNIPPTREGVLGERDVACLLEVGKRIRSTYGTNLAKGATISVPNLADRDIRTFWKLKDTNGEFTVKLPKKQTVTRLVLQEAIADHGQRIRKHAIDAKINGEWQEIAAANSIGYKRIHRFNPVTTNEFRVRILDARLAPAIAEFSAHHYKGPENVEESKRNKGISKENWKVTASSSHSAEYAAKKAIDGDTKTFWHTNWDKGHPSHPHTFTIDLGKAETLKAFTYLPRQDNIPDSMVEAFKLEASLNGKTWFSLGEGEFGNIFNDPTQREFHLKNPTTFRHIRFTSTKGAQNKPYAGAAEIGLLK